MKKSARLRTQQYHKGFTVIEILATVSIMAIMAAIAAPSMRSYILNGRIKGVTQELLRSFQTARTEALKRELPVVVCASGNPTGILPVCAALPGSDISGWIVFQDDNNSWQRNVGEALIEVHTFDNTKFSILADQNRRLSYTTTGFLNTFGGVNTTSIVVCDSRGNVDGGNETAANNSVARGIIITNTGRARVTQVRNSSSDMFDIADLLNNTGGSC